MAQRIETVVIGGGQGGLAASYHLKQKGREHLVLEADARAANAWRNDRWDSFTLVTPNWTARMPGAEYRGTEPGGFMSRKEIIGYFEEYIRRFDLPVRYGVRVSSVEPAPGGRGYTVRAGDTVFEAAHVVVATGLFQRPRRPAYAANLSVDRVQLDAGQYRNPATLPPGAVLVVGSGQSGCQIAEELYQSGRRVYLSVSGAGRVPRRYRGKDIIEWLHLNRFLDRTPEQLPSPKARFAPNPQVTGRGGGHTLNLHRFARDGVVLLGRVRGAQADAVQIAPDLRASLAQVDRFEAEVVKMIDSFIAQNGIEAPPEELPRLQDGYNAEVLSEVNLQIAGIRTIVWACGYDFDFRLVRLPVFDSFGFPLQRQGISDYPGLYFVGLPWLPGQKSGLLLGVGENAGHVASAIAADRS